MPFHLASAVFSSQAPSCRQWLTVWHPGTVPHSVKQDKRDTAAILVSITWPESLECSEAAQRHDRKSSAKMLGWKTRTSKTTCSNCSFRVAILIDLFAQILDFISRVFLYNQMQPALIYIGTAAAALHFFTAPQSWAVYVGPETVKRMATLEWMKMYIMAQQQWMKWR